MPEIRIGLVGYGGMGSNHCRYLWKNPIPGARLAAVCDVRPERLRKAKEEHGEDMPVFESAGALLDAGIVDAVFIATPHYDHPTIAIAAFERGLHVLTEKPAGVYTKQVREMNAAAKRAGTVFGIMYNQRTTPAPQKMREILQSGELGEMHRVMLEVTQWYRTQAYYDGGGWRATWKGEGGGILINQCPHDLDLWQWVCGMPSAVTARMGFGRHHDIEVEDDVSALVEYPNGATGTFIATTGEAPGVRRWEVVCDGGTLSLEGSQLSVTRLAEPVSQHLKTSKQTMQAPEGTTEIIPLSGGGDHREITAGWIDAITTGAPLLAPGEEGVRGLEISNAMHMSAWLDRKIDLPIDHDAYAKLLREKIESSTVTKSSGDDKVMEFAGTF